MTSFLSAEPSGILLALCAVVSACVVLVATLGFLALPVPATTLWTSALALALVACWGAITATALGLPPSARTIALAPLTGVPAMIWSGFRASRGARSFGWVGPAIAVLGVGMLWWLQNESTARLALFLQLIAAGVFAVLLVIELVFLARTYPRLTAPVVLTSALIPVLVVAAIVVEIATGSSTALDAVHALLSIAMIVYVVAVTVTVLSLVATWRAAPSTTGMSDPVLPAPQFVALATERLRRIATRGERTWTFIDFRMDELRKIQAATGDVAVETVTGHFERAIAAVFPADADLGRGESGQVLVLVSLPAVAATESVRTVLTRLRDDYAGNPLAVRLTASAGVVPIGPAAAELPQLRRAASIAVEAARDDGGDRWRRVDPPVAAV